MIDCDFSMNLHTSDGEPISITRVIKAGAGLLGHTKGYTDPAAYEIFVSTFLARNNVAKNMAHTTVKLLAKSFPALISPEILDISAGTGLFSGALTRLGATVTATDISPQQLDYLESHKRAARTKIMDFNSPFDFADGTFDGVVTLAANRYIKNLQAFASEVHRILKPGGIFIWPLFWQDNMTFIKTQHRIITPNSLARILKRAGFSEHKILILDSIKDGALIFPKIAAPTYIFGKI